MKTLVTYASIYGTTKQYAYWIAEELSCDIRESKTVDEKTLEQYDVILHGGGLYAGGLLGLQPILKHFSRLEGKHVILFSCGLSDPMDSKVVADIEANTKKIMNPEKYAKVKYFHLRGGIDYSRLNLLHRGMMAMVCSQIRKKGYENLNSEDRQMLDTYEKKVDFTDRNTIVPILEYVKGLE